jgi:hypothetical protein
MPSALERDELEEPGATRLLSSLLFSVGGLTYVACMRTIYEKWPGTTIRNTPG